MVIAALIMGAILCLKAGSIPPTVTSIRWEKDWVIQLPLYLSFPWWTNVLFSSFWTGALIWVSTGWIFDDADSKNSLVSGFFIAFCIGVGIRVTIHGGTLGLSVLCALSSGAIAALWTFWDKGFFPGLSTTVGTVLGTGLLIGMSVSLGLGLIIAFIALAIEAMTIIFVAAFLFFFLVGVDIALSYLLRLGNLHLPTRILVTLNNCSLCTLWLP